jgi:hypothetical protein
MSVRHKRVGEAGYFGDQMPLELEVAGDQHISVGYNSTGMVELL